MSSSASRSSRGGAGGSRSSSVASRRRTSSPRRPDCRSSTSTRRSGRIRVGLAEPDGRRGRRGRAGRPVRRPRSCRSVRRGGEVAAPANIRKALDALPERERRILELRFGFQGEPWTLEAIGRRARSPASAFVARGPGAVALAALRDLAGPRGLTQPVAPASGRNGPLVGGSSSVELLEERHREGLRRAVDAGPEILRYTAFSGGFRPLVRRRRWKYDGRALRGRRRKAREVGSTRYLKLAPEHRRVEIGGPGCVASLGHRRRTSRRRCSCSRTLSTTRPAACGAQDRRPQRAHARRPARVGRAVRGNLPQAHDPPHGSASTPAWYAIVEDRLRRPWKSGYSGRLDAKLAS